MSIPAPMLQPPAAAVAAAAAAVGAPQLLPGMPTTAVSALPSASPAAGAPSAFAYGLVLPPGVPPPEAMTLPLGFVPPAQPALSAADAKAAEQAAIATAIAGHTGVHPGAAATAASGVIGAAAGALDPATDVRSHRANKVRYRERLKPWWEKAMAHDYELLTALNAHVAALSLTNAAHILPVNQFRAGVKGKLRATDLAITRLDAEGRLLFILAHQHLYEMLVDRYSRPVVHFKVRAHLAARGDALPARVHRVLTQLMLGARVHAANVRYVAAHLRSVVSAFMGGVEAGVDTVEEEYALAHQQQYNAAIAGTGGVTAAAAAAAMAAAMTPTGYKRTAHAAAMDEANAAAAAAAAAAGGGGGMGGDEGDGSGGSTPPAGDDDEGDEDVAHYA